MDQETSLDLKKSIGPSLLGEYLKQKRIDKNYSLEKLSQKTKITINILKHLEANDYEHLPSAAYIKGFVISYAKALGIPLAEAIANMEYTYLTVSGRPFPALNHTKRMQQKTASIQSADQPQEADGPHELIENHDRIIENTKSALPFIVFISVILIFIGGYHLISSIVDDEVQGQRVPDHGPKIESSSALVKQPEVSPTANQTEQSSDTSSQADNKTEETKPIVEFERNFPHVDFKKFKGKLFQIKPDAPENRDISVLPEAIKYSAIASMQNVYIRAIDGNTWLSYKIDNNPIESAIISKGNALFLQGNEIRVFLGNINVTKIFYNNQLIDAHSKSGVKSLVFPEESSEKYVQPLFPKAKDDILYTSDEYLKRMQLEEEELKKRRQ